MTLESNTRQRIEFGVYIALECIVLTTKLVLLVSSADGFDHNDSETTFHIGVD